MSNAHNENNPTSRRAFIQRTSLAAFATAGAATALLGSPNAALACTPIPPWLRPEIYQKLLDSFRPVEDLTKKWIVSLGDQNNQTMGMFAFRYFIDDYCGTVPKRPPVGPPPQFLAYEKSLPGFSRVQTVVGRWADGSVRIGVAPVIALSILRDDIQAGMMFPAQAQAFDGAQAEGERIRLWRPWWPC